MSNRSNNSPRFDIIYNLKIKFVISDKQDLIIPAINKTSKILEIKEIIRDSINIVPKYQVLVDRENKLLNDSDLISSTSIKRNDTIYCMIAL